MTRKMKDSGIEWIGEIPEDWEVVKIRHIAFAESSGLSVDNLLDDGNYEVYDANKLVGYLDNNPVKTNYISIIKDGAGVGRTRLMQQNTNVIGTMNYIIAKNIDLNYLYYTLQVFDFEKYATGSTIPHIYFKDYANEYIALQDNKVQKDIVKHLDFEVDKIIKLVDKVNEQIENLEDYKKSIITEAVTKGLDKNVEMKDSGIEWIGEIPKHWNMLRIKNLGICRNGLTYSPSDTCDEKDGTLVLRSSNVQNGKIVLNNNVYVKKRIPDYLMVKNGDILICSRNGSKELIGKNAIINNIDATFGAFMMIYRSKNPKLMYYVLNSNIFQYYLGTFFTSTINQLTNSNFENMKIVWCDDINEQEQIVRYLDKKTKLIDDSIAIKQKQLDTLEEYKKSLIYEYVTGKKEVNDGEES